MNLEDENALKAVTSIILLAALTVEGTVLEDSKLASEAHIYACNGANSLVEEIKKRGWGVTP